MKAVQRARESFWFVSSLHLMVAVVYLAAATTTARGADPITFAVFGDYGDNSGAELAVSNLVKSWNPDFILAAGDNNYPSGSAATIDVNIGKYYQEFIGNYTGAYGPGAGNGPLDNRFFPVLGNHDWGSGSGPHTNYFTLPGNGYVNSSGNERYYDFKIGEAHFFMYDSQFAEPDGVTLGSTQANWLRDGLQASSAKWKFVVMHDPPYSSSSHGSHGEVQLPYKDWGADAVFAGDDHVYERINRDDVMYFTTGLGGKSIYGFGAPVAGSEVRYNANYGSMLVTVDANQAKFEFWSISGGGQRIDTYVIPEPPSIILLAALGLLGLLAFAWRRRFNSIAKRRHSTFLLPSRVRQ